MNGFPSDMFDQLVRRFLKNIFEPKPNVRTVRKKIVYFHAFLSLAHTLFKFEPKSPQLVTLLIPILTFDLPFAPPHASLLSFRLKIKFPFFLNLVLYTYSSVDVVPRRMGVKPHAIYTPGCQNTWESLL